MQSIHADEGSDSDYMDTLERLETKIEMKFDDMDVGHSALCATVQAQRDLIKLLAENLEKSCNGEQIDAEALERLKLAKWQ